MQSVSSGAVYNAINNYLPQKINVLGRFSTTGSVAYFKATGMMNGSDENVFLLQSRAGELLIISIGYDDGGGLQIPKVKRLLNAYSKIAGVSYLSNGSLVFAVEPYSHDCILTQLTGTSKPSVTISNSSYSEFYSGTLISIET